MRTSRRFPLLLPLIIAVLVAAFAAPFAGHPALAQSKPEVAYVYSQDAAARESFRSLLELRGYTFIPVTLGNAPSFDFSTVDAVIIADDTGSAGGEWLGSADIAAIIRRAERYTIGVGYGGAQFFSLVGISINWGNSTDMSQRGVMAVSPGAPFWLSPAPVDILPGDLVRLYGANTPGRSVIDGPDLSVNAIRLGRQIDVADRYPLMAETFNGQFGTQCNVLWGFRRSPMAMSIGGRDLFTNILSKNVCENANGPSTDLSITKKATPATATVGSTITYEITVTNNGRVSAPDVKVIDSLPASTVFVSATSTVGSCGHALGTVTCSLGTLAGGSSATITIVVKALEPGKPVNRAIVRARIRDTNSENNTSSATSEVTQRANFTPIFALPYLPLKVIDTPVLFPQDLGIHGIEVTQGIQCFNTANGLAGCPDNSLPLVNYKGSTARIYLRYNGLFASRSNVPVRLVIIDANNVEYPVNITGKALPAIDQSAAGNSANVYFTVNFNNTNAVRFYAIVDPNNVITETNESNNRFPASGTISANYYNSTTMKIVGQRLRYHPSGYSGEQYAGGWAVNGGASSWFNQLLPLRTNAINYQVKSGYLNWTTTMNSDGQHSLIQNLNWNWTLENTLSWLFGTGAFTGSRHVYGWVPGAAWGGGHADMPVYPHAGGLGIVGIGTDTPGTSTDSPGAGALIFGHELVHDYDIKHTDVTGDCGSSDSSSDFPYSSASIQEFGFNPATGKVYNPSATHDLMSYCPAGGSKEGWISPFTWNRMFKKFNPSVPVMVAKANLQPAAELQTADSVLLVNMVINNPNLGAHTASLGTLYQVNATVPISMPVTGEYALEFLDGSGAPLQTIPFEASFESEYTGDPPHLNHDGENHELPVAELSFVIPWVEGTANIRVLFNGTPIGQKSVSAGAPSVLVTAPSAAQTWAVGTTQTLSWQGNDPDGDALSYSLFYSVDGENWQLLAEGLSDTSYQIAVDDLHGAAAARFRVVASDGVYIADDETDGPITVPDKAPVALITSPAGGTSIGEGELLVLQGQGTDFEDGTLNGELMAWSSDRQGALGTGESLPVNSLQPGLHRITLAVSDSGGHTSTTSIEIYIGFRVFMPMTLR